MVGLINPTKYGQHFFDLFTTNLQRSLKNDDKDVTKRKVKEKKAHLLAEVAGIEANAGNKQVDAQLIKQQLLTLSNFSMAYIPLESNASKFALYCAIRSAVLETEASYAFFQTDLQRKNLMHNKCMPCCVACIGTCGLSNYGECSCHLTIESKDKLCRNDSANSDDAESETEDAIEKDVPLPMVPLLVGAGLRSLFELIAEARYVQATLCTKALKALLDVIQGLQPEAFKGEPEDLINPLYDMLLDLATVSLPHPVGGDNIYNWSATACAALIGLSIARGDTGKILKAVAALLMSPKCFLVQKIQMPLVLASLQKTVICAALGKPNRLDFHTQGVPLHSLLNEFPVKLICLDGSIVGQQQPIMTADGTFLYLLIGSVLYKIGSGFNGSCKGHIYAKNEAFTKEKTGWLGFASGHLYFRRNSKRTTDHLHIVNTDTLTMEGVSTLSLNTMRETSNFVLFTDEDGLNAICTTRDDTLIVKRVLLNQSTSDRNAPSFELPLQLARKKFRTLGYAAFEEELLNQSQMQKIQSSCNSFEPKLPNGLEVHSIVCGKEFGIVRDLNGRIYYYGKPASLGLKSTGRTATMKPTELIISKAANIVHVAMGHDGVHALLVNDDGSVYFTGTARRGEDGDSSKNRRQPKPVKPKKITKVESHFVVQAACNNGTSAFITKTGKLIMFGKDAMHCDASGFVTELMDQHITKVALGKAHCVVLNAKGQVFTYGLNNKGQCGRSFAKTKDAAYGSGQAGENNEKTATNMLHNRIKFDYLNLCDYDDHILSQGQCRVCVLCRECTGYNVSCVSALNVPIEERLAGASCPCGQGDAGCSKCGLCASCITKQENEADIRETKQMLSDPFRQTTKNFLIRRRDKNSRDEGCSLAELDKDPPRVAPLDPQLLTIPNTTSPVVQVACGLHHTVLLTLAGEVYTFGSNQYGQLGTGDLQPVSGPVRVNINSAVSQVAAGSNHTVLLTHRGIVYTFGNYQKGQLGRFPNDVQHRTLADEYKGRSFQQETNFSNVHNQRQRFLWNCNPSAVFGLGMNYGKRATWIGASGDQTFIKVDESLITSQMLSKIHVVANSKTILFIPTIPLSFHTLTINRSDGSCTAHYRNQVNFSQIIQSQQKSAEPEINQNVENNLANQEVAPGIQSAAVASVSAASSMQDQMCKSMHEAHNQAFDLRDHNEVKLQDRRRLQQQQMNAGTGPNLTVDKHIAKLCFAMDPNYNVLWLYNNQTMQMQCYNVLTHELTRCGSALITPELALPCKSDVDILRQQAALNLLVCLDILTSAQDAIPSCFEEPITKQPDLAKEAQSTDYQIVNRFDNFGGGWGYSGHSVEAIRFSADTDIIIYGFGIFGGRGEYTCKLKLFDLGVDGGGYEKEGQLISETKEVPFECAARSKYHLILPKPVSVVAGRWYLVWARIAGPSSDCGSCGQVTVTTEDQVVFTFKSSKKANNGTDVNSGQIPAILYRLLTQETKQPTAVTQIDPVHKISKAFATSVTKECFESLVILLRWAWDTLKANIRDKDNKERAHQLKQSTDYLRHVNKSCLRLLRKYTNDIYPQATTAEEDKHFKDAKDKYGKPAVSTSSTGGMRKMNLENIQLAECVGNIRALLISIFCDDILQETSDVSSEAHSVVLDILDECHVSFVACFDAFYPTSSLKWNCLCELLSQMDKQGTLHSRLLSAILAGLCSPSVKLRSTFSLFNANNDRYSVISPSDNSGLPMLSSTESHQYPILVEQMIYRTQLEKSDYLTTTWCFKDVLVRLLDIIANPVRTRIDKVCNRRAYISQVDNRQQHVNQGLIDNCCHLLARVLAEIVYQTTLHEFDTLLIPSRTLYSTGSRFARCDVSRTWNTGNFGPDAIAFSVDRVGIAIVGAMVYSGSGNYEYQLELLYDTSAELQPQHKWETLETVTGSYDQDAVQNDMAEIKFERPVHLKENARYALRLCSQGARTCSGDAGLPSVRGPCGTNFYFYTCDLSFNGTTAQRGQIPCLLYYSTPVKNSNSNSNNSNGASALNSNCNEVTARETALQIASDIIKKCTDLLILTRNAVASLASPSDNSSNHTQTIDSEHNITPIEEHMDINWVNNSRTATPIEPTISTRRDLSKRFESFSKGIIETLKFEKSSTNPFEMEIEIGATEIHPKDLLYEEAVDVKDLNYRNGDFAKLNGNEHADNVFNIQNKQPIAYSDSDETPVTQFNIESLQEIFNRASSNMFHTLLPLVFAHISNLACKDPKSSVQILGLVKDILPHVSALNQMFYSKEESFDVELSKRLQNVMIGQRDCLPERRAENTQIATVDMCTTSNHYCTVESDHPYRSATVSCYRVEFPNCVQWLTIEFDGKCGTAQPEDNLIISIPMRATHTPPKSPFSHACKSDQMEGSDCAIPQKTPQMVDLISCSGEPAVVTNEPHENSDGREWMIVKKIATAANWPQTLLILPGNCVEFSLETSSLYAQDPHVNRYGFKCLVIGYDNPTAINNKKSCLLRLEQELSYLGGMCCAYLMKKEVYLPVDDKDFEDLNAVEETIQSHHTLLSKGFALYEPVLTVEQALEPQLPIGSQSNERQFLKDFISGAPGSSGGRLASWLQPEPRLDPNKCELSPIDDTLRHGWPAQITVIIRDQYGDPILVPDLKVEVKAIPTGHGGSSNIKLRRQSSADHMGSSTCTLPRHNYEPTIKEKMCFKAITFMKPFNNYSFEELRFNSPIQTRITENLSGVDMEDGTFNVQWTPNSVGNYCLTVNIDGIQLEEVYRVEVKEGGELPPANLQNLKKPQAPNKLRMFYTKNTAGLRIRSHPTLQSEQVGIIKLNGLISYIDEIENDDGVWLRLSTESIRQHCTMGWYPTEAWCLQYNQHLDKTFLHPVADQTDVIAATPTQLAPAIAASDSTLPSQGAHGPDTMESTMLLPTEQTLSSQQADVSRYDELPDSASTSLKSVSCTNPFLNAKIEHSDMDISTISQTGKVFPQHTPTTIALEEASSASALQGSNISSAIAGVVGGGASKLQALQKWLKGDADELACSASREQSPSKRTDVAEIASVSVRDLVRAMGGKEGRSNGNSASPTPTRRTPLAERKFGESKMKQKLQDSCDDFDLTNIRKTNFTPSQKAALLSTPKHSPRRSASNIRQQHILSNSTSTSTSATNSTDETDIIQLEDESNLLQVTTITSGTNSVGQEQIIFSETKSINPSNPENDFTSTTTWQSANSVTPMQSEKKIVMGPIKRAMPPSFAESIRAVFAAFLWHEGIVHDAMACASFLKFHPALPKEGATVVTRKDQSDSKLQLTREQKAQQRHSVEVANAGHYLNIRPSTLETLARSGNSSLNNRKYRKTYVGDAVDSDEKSKLHTLPEVVTVLPPALRCLVFLWEQICLNCVQIVQSNALERAKPPTPTNESLAETKEKTENNDREPKKPKKKKREDGSWCEICEVYLPIPVTYHMRIVHPGCGKSAKGKGYNSVGMFCEGWAGNCGEGGKGASSWFLMCDACRTKYMSAVKITTNVNHVAKANTIGNEMNLFDVKSSSILINSDVYTTMRDNANFLLELSPSASTTTAGILSECANNIGATGNKRSPQQMPVVVEHQHWNTADLNYKPSTSRAETVRNSRIGLRMTGKLEPVGSQKMSINCVESTFTNNVWDAPENFACMKTLGIVNNDDLPYEMFNFNASANGIDRPISQVSYNNADPNNYEMLVTSTTSQPAGAGAAGNLSKFHRSLSMGQGWGLAQHQQTQAASRLTNTEDAMQMSKVVYRRRNNSINGSDGSLLMCYPSENLRKLVPENMLTSSIVHTASPRVDYSSFFDGNNLQNANDPKNQDSTDSNVIGDSFNFENLPPLNGLVIRPAMAFIMQKHDLDRLRFAMKRSLRIAACRIYSLQALNWLVRSVTQGICLHDLMWWFVSSLSLPSITPAVDCKNEEIETSLEHPVSCTQISGHFSVLVTECLHIFLQSIADLTLYLPLGSPLQRIAIQCFGIRFQQSDHQFLHNSHVFANISKILSKSEEQSDDVMAALPKLPSGINFGVHDNEHNLQHSSYVMSIAGARIVQYTDLHGMFDVIVSSRPAMVESLTDNSTETFWESDEEDRNKCKIIEVSMNKQSHICKTILVHIDNSRDIQNKVISVTFYAGPSLADTQLIKVVEVDQKACTWISAKLNDDNHTHFRLEFLGQESTLRVRQIKLLGLARASNCLDDNTFHALGNDATATQHQTPHSNAQKCNYRLFYAPRIHHQLCEAETLRVFRLITGQVFGKLITTANENNRYTDERSQSGLRIDSSTTSLLADSLDLREHMVGILFSRSKLSHLQKQVIVHIVHAIKKEAQRAKEEWECANLSSSFKHVQNSGDVKSDSSSERCRAPDTYCFEMLSMVLALSGSAVGRTYLSHQHSLLKDLLTLLHTGSDRVQRQVTALLRRILPEISPQNFSELLGVHQLPPTDYSIVHQNAFDFDMNRLGLLDIFLAVIAKSLQLQVKVKTTASKSNLEKTPTFIRLCNSLDLSVHMLKPKNSKDPSQEMDLQEHEVEAQQSSLLHQQHYVDTFMASNEHKSFSLPLQSTPHGVKSKKNLNQRWFLNGSISTKQAENIIQLIRDLTSGKLSEKWSQLTKAAIAESVLNLTRLDEVFRTPEHCIKTATLWLALASLCVLDRDHVDKLSSGQWSKVTDTRPMCLNHDDGETTAIIQCETCGSLCSDCDRYLHLNRKTRYHKRTVCKEEEEAIRVELHESCGRTKLFWLLALADSKTLKAMVEFRDGSHTIISGPPEAIGRCRFCGITGNSGLLEIGNVCADTQCQEHAANSCSKTKPCGHLCGGVVNEKKCLPCLQHECHDKENEMAEEYGEPKLTQDADDMCMICFVEALSCAPSIHLDCGHVFHFHCCRAVLEKRWTGPRITFGFSLCPICKADIHHKMLADILEPINVLKQDVTRKALMRIKYEGIVKDTDSKDVTNLAMDRYAYYVCFKCQKAYYGGEARCDAEIDEKFDPEELVCGGCSDVARAKMCPKHGTDFLEYKCRYCCSVAVFFCFGTTHFCDTCHDDFQRLTNIPKNKLPQCPAGPKAKQLLGDECPLHIIHPPTGEEFALGCGVCRNAQTF